MTEAIEALKAYKAKCHNDGDIYGEKVVQSCIALLQRLEKKKSCPKIPPAILQPGQV